MRCVLIVLTLALALVPVGPAAAQRWVTSWVAPGQQLATGAGGLGQDQTARVIVRPSVWATRARLRFSNAFGTTPLQIDSVYAGVQAGGAALVPGTNKPVTFASKKTAVIPPGGQVWSDAVILPATGPTLAVSLHWQGEAGTGHAHMPTTSYLTPAGAGALGELEDEGAFSVPTAAVPLLDAVDIQSATDIPVVLCFGDSLTDVTTAIPNARDRWTDVLERRLRATGFTGAVLNAGLAPDRSPGTRLDRDVFSLSGVTHVIWLYGADELAGSAATDTVRDGMTAQIRRIREKLPRAKLILGTLPGADAPGRWPLNMQIRTLQADGMVPFDRADAADPGSFGGQLAMGQAVDLRLLTGLPTATRRPASRSAASSPSAVSSPSAASSPSGAPR